MQKEILGKALNKATNVPMNTGPILNCNLSVNKGDLPEPKSRSAVGSEMQNKYNISQMGPYEVGRKTDSAMRPPRQSAYEAA